MNSKKAQLGSIMITFVATIIIILILLAFVFSSGMLKSYYKAERNVRVHGNVDTGLNDIFVYGEEYSKILENRFLLARENQGVLGDG
jgi:putative lipase involved disintegration of autophagic bodies